MLILRVVIAFGEKKGLAKLKAVFAITANKYNFRGGARRATVKF